MKKWSDSEALNSDINSVEGTDGVRSAHNGRSHHHNPCQSGILPLLLVTV